MNEMHLGHLRWTLHRIGTPAVTLLAGLSPYRTDVWVASIVCLVAAAYVGIVEFIVRPKQYDREVLEAFLLGFLAILDIPETADIRCALYLPLRDKGDNLKAMTAYVPNNGKTYTEPSTKLLPSSKGIVGWAYRSEKAMIWMLSEDETETHYKEKLTGMWSFTKVEALKLTLSRRCFVSIPVFDSRNIIKAIIYLDSVDPALLVGTSQEETLDRMEKTAKLLEPLMRTMEGKPQ